MAILGTDRDLYKKKVAIRLQDRDPKNIGSVIRIDDNHHYLNDSCDKLRRLSVAAENGLIDLCSQFHQIVNQCPFRVRL